jgi:hypothetical protein
MEDTTLLDVTQSQPIDLAWTDDVAPGQRHGRSAMID